MLSYQERKPDVTNERKDTESSTNSYLGSYMKCNFCYADRYEIKDGAKQPAT
jgi:DNA repair photolyase